MIGRPVEGFLLITRIGSAETPIAIGMAWLILSEAPPVPSIIGSCVVLVAVLAHARGDFA
jgi:drug/metabolite transporter (DMT)-like permease